MNVQTQCPVNSKLQQIQNLATPECPLTLQISQLASSVVEKYREALSQTQSLKNQCVQGIAAPQNSAHERFKRVAKVCDNMEFVFKDMAILKLKFLLQRQVEVTSFVNRVKGFTLPEGLEDKMTTMEKMNLVAILLGEITKPNEGVSLSITGLAQAVLVPTLRMKLS